MLNSTAGTCTARHLRARTLPRLLIIPLYRFWVGSVSCRSKNSSRQYKLADAACRTGQRVILSPHCIRHDPWNKTLKATSIRTCSGTPPICWIVSGGSHDVIEVPPKSLSRMPIGTCRISMSCRLQQAPHDEVTAATVVKHTHAIRMCVGPPRCCRVHRATGCQPYSLAFPPSAAHRLKPRLPLRSKRAR